MRNPIKRREQMHGRFHESRMARHLRCRGLTITDAGESVLAYVSDGRWVADCACNGGMAVDPETPWAACWDCGRRYAVVLPPDWRAAEKVLERRESHRQHWRPERESIDDLERENIRYGVR